MSVLLQISDTRFGTEQPQVVEALVALAAQQRPDVVVLSGDIARYGRPSFWQRRPLSTGWARRFWPSPATTILRCSTSGHA